MKNRKYLKSWFLIKRRKKRILETRVRRRRVWVSLSLSRRMSSTLSQFHLFLGWSLIDTFAGRSVGSSEGEDRRDSSKFGLESVIRPVDSMPGTAKKPANKGIGSKSLALVEWITVFESSESCDLPLDSFSCCWYWSLIVDRWLLIFDRDLLECWVLLCSLWLLMTVRFILCDWYWWVLSSSCSLELLMMVGYVTLWSLLYQCRNLCDANAKDGNKAPLGSSIRCRNISCCGHSSRGWC